MLETVRSWRGAVVAPHHLAARAGLRVLEDGGNAVEAMIAAAAAISVVYPHMNNLGGDNFWLIAPAGEDPVGIDACGAAAAKANIDFYRELGCDAIPSRGPLAALTVPGAVSGWQGAEAFSRRRLGGKLPVSRLLEDAAFFARDGVAVTNTLANNAAGKFDELKDAPGFTDVYTHGDTTVRTGERLHQPRIATALDRLASAGFDDFYRGDLARSMAADIERVGSPLALGDLERHRALDVSPLGLTVGGHRIFNMPPPTQGLASLMLLGIFERLGVTEAEGFDFIHGLVESTKSAFRVRDRYVTDPVYMTVAPEKFLDAMKLDAMAATIDRAAAAPWPDATGAGDTVWLGAIDAQGNAVSMIQSVYWEFGSGVILPESGITLQNRGTSFSLDPAHHNCLQPFRRPFHTIQPAMARLADGRIMSYGTMGGEGQPQTQAMVFARHVLYGQELQRAITAPRWLLGRTWGSSVTNLRMENRFDPEVIERLRETGHDIDMVGPFDEVMGHAGALVRHPDGLIESAADPRSDGQAAAF
ncbi:MAG: gamma-glutamyltransferase [Rhodospirillales bacterium]